MPPIGPIIVFLHLPLVNPFRPMSADMVVEKAAYRVLKMCSCHRFLKMCLWKNLRRTQKKNPKKPLQNSLSPNKGLSEHKNLFRQIRIYFLHHCSLVYTEKGWTPRELLPLTLYSVVGGTLGKMWEGIDAKPKEYVCGFFGGHCNPRGFP